MTIELSKKELEMLDEALVSWQKEPSTQGFGMSLMNVMLRSITKKEGMPDDPEDGIEKERDKAEQDSKHRERQALLLRSKLMQAVARASEHELETH